MQRTLGIDLGTTNSVMAYIKKGQPVIIYNRLNLDLTPSVVGRGKQGELLVGTNAKHRVIDDPGNVIYSIKRFMGRKYADPKVQEALEKLKLRYQVTEGPDGDVQVRWGGRDYTPTEISAVILHRLREDAESKTGEEFGRAVITVPAYFGERQVATTQEAGRMAGFHVLHIINEPTAAALAFGFDRERTDECRTVMVYDLGGGTFDISIIMLMQGAVTVMGIEGDNFLGGDDFDRSVTKWIFKQAGKGLKSGTSTEAIIAMAAEAAKIALSSDEPVASIRLPTFGPNSANYEIDLSRATLEEMIGERIEKTISLTQKALTDAHLAPDDIDYLLLVGGSSAIPLVQRSLAGLFGARKLRRDMNPMQCVAIGAALQSALLREIECPVCRKRNSIHDDFCQDCSTSLGGFPKVACPVCFVPCDPAPAQCWKCSASLESAGKALVWAVSPAVTVPIFEKCPACGTPYKAGLAVCPICKEVLTEKGGLRCAQCGRINPPGVVTCQKCGSDMPITNPIDQIPKPIGIEMQDGSLSVVLAKGTVYPTPVHEYRDYGTSVAGQRHLDVLVYEGDQQTRAKDNELLGVVSIPLPEGLPRGTRVKIGMGLDEKRTLAVLVTPPGGAERHRIILRSSPLDPEKVERIDAERRKVIAFTDRWAEELTDQEKALFDSLIDRLDDAVSDSRGNTGPLSVDSLLDDAERILESASSWRGANAVAGNLIGWEARYLDAESRTELERLNQQVSDARRHGDWDQAERVADEIHARLPVLAGPVLPISWARNLVLHRRLSPALSHRVSGALHVIDDAIPSGNEERFAQGLATLNELWDEIDEELSVEKGSAPTVTKPSEWRGA